MLSFSLFENAISPPMQNFNQPQKKQGMGTGAKLAIGAGLAGAGLYGMTQTDWYKNNQAAFEQQHRAQYAAAAKQYHDQAIDALNKNQENINKNHGFIDRTFGTGGYDDKTQLNDTYKQNVEKEYQGHLQNAQSMNPGSWIWNNIKGLIFNNPNGAHQFTQDLQSQVVQQQGQGKTNFTVGALNLGKQMEQHENIMKSPELPGQ